MKPKGFTFIELLLVIICIAVLVTGAGFSFKRAKISHMADTFVQELVILKTAIGTYYESHGTFLKPDSEETPKLSTYGKLKNLWKPFNPDASKVLADTCWCGNIAGGLDEVYLQLHRYEFNNGQRTNKTTPVEFSPAEIKVLQKKMESVCKVEKLSSGGYACYLFLEPDMSASSPSSREPQIQ